MCVVPLCPKAARMTAVGLWERQVEGAERAARDIARYGGHGLSSRVERERRMRA